MKRTIIIGASVFALVSTGISVAPTNVQNPEYTTYRPCFSVSYAGSDGGDTPQGGTGGNGSGSGGGGSSGGGGGSGK